MTGLDPEKERIIEAAAIVTDWDFKEIASLDLIVKQSDDLLSKMDNWNKSQHKASGLLDKIAQGTSESEAEKQLLGLIEKHCQEPIILAGNSVHHDRRFIRRAWPKLDAKLHYRMLDVSAWKVVMMNKFDQEFKKREAHRALDDIRGSIEELIGYVDWFRTKFHD